MSRGAVDPLQVPNSSYKLGFLPPRNRADSEMGRSVGMGKALRFFTGRRTGSVDVRILVRES